MGSASPIELEVASLLIETVHLELSADEIDPTAPLFGDGLGLDSIDALGDRARHLPALWVRAQVGRRAEPPDLCLAAKPCRPCREASDASFGRDSARRAGLAPGSGMASNSSNSGRRRPPAAHHARRDEILFRRAAGEPVTCARFLRDVAATAERLPDRRYALNLCSDRYQFLVAFAAVLVRGQVSLLSSDRTPHALEQLVASYPRGLRNRRRGHEAAADRARALLREGGEQAAGTDVHDTGPADRRHRRHLRQHRRAGAARQALGSAGRLQRGGGRPVRVCGPMPRRRSSARSRRSTCTGSRPRSCCRSTRTCRAMPAAPSFPTTSPRPWPPYRRRGSW